MTTPSPRKNVTKFTPFEQDKRYVFATLRSVHEYARGIGLTAGWGRGHESPASFFLYVLSLHVRVLVYVPTRALSYNKATYITFVYALHDTAARSLYSHTLGSSSRGFTPTS